MKRTLLIFLVVLIGLLGLTLDAKAADYKGFLVEEVIGSDKILITDGISHYLVTYSFFGCSSLDFASGKTIYIDTYFSPSIFNKIVVEGFSGTETCDVSNSEDLNLKKYFVDSVIDSEDSIIAIDKFGDKYLVEYGIGCLSMWRYEGKNIDIDIGGSILDGIGDRIYLFDSDDDCKVWDADELSGNYSGASSASYSGTTYAPSAAPTSSCPANSYSTGSGCSCNDGYQPDTSKTYCIAKPKPSCPTNSNLVGESCICNAGLLWKNNQCISHTDDCRITFGENVVGKAGPDNNSNCDCSSGYQWNANQTACLKIEAQIPVVAPQLPLPTQTKVEEPETELFKTDESKIKLFNEEITVGLKVPGAFRVCPSTQCMVIRYYAEVASVQVVGEYTDGRWYKVKAKDDNGKILDGWMHNSVLEVVEKGQIPEIQSTTTDTTQNGSWIKRLWWFVFGKNKI